MKPITKIAMSALIAGSFSTTAMAKVYGDIGVSYASVDAELDGNFVGADADGDSFNIQGHIGYEFNKYFDLESELIFGADGDDFEGADIGVAYLLSAFARAKYPVTSSIDVFGRVGYTNGEIEGINTLGKSEDINVDGVAFGIGGIYDIGNGGGIRLDVTQYILEGDTNGVDVDGDTTSVFIGYVFDF